MAEIADIKGAFKIEFNLDDAHIDLMRRNTTTGEYHKYGAFVYLMDCRNKWAWNYITDTYGESCMDVTELGDILYLLKLLNPPTY